MCILSCFYSDLSEGCAMELVQPNQAFFVAGDGKAQFEITASDSDDQPSALASLCALT